MLQGGICGLPVKPVRYREAAMVFPGAGRRPSPRPRPWIFLLPAGLGGLGWGAGVKHAQGKRLGGQHLLDAPCVAGCRGGNGGREGREQRHGAHRARHILCSFLGLFLLDVNQACHHGTKQEEDLEADVLKAKQGAWQGVGGGSSFGDAGDR